MAYWLIDRLIDWLIDWLTDRLINWLIDGLIDWLIDWFIDWLIDWLSNVISRKVGKIYSRYIWICKTGHSYFFSIHREQDARITALQSEKEYVLFVLLCFEILINNQILSSMQLTGHNDVLRKNTTRKEEQAVQKSNCSLLKRFKSYHVS